MRSVDVILACMWDRYCHTFCDICELITRRCQPFAQVLGNLAVYTTQLETMANTKFRSKFMTHDGCSEWKKMQEDFKSEFASLTERQRHISTS